MLFELVVTSGPDKGIQYPLPEGKTVVVGRGQEAVLQLTDPRVSRKHFVIEVSDGKIELLNAGGSGGTTVNSETVETRELQPGDVIGLGDSELKLILPESACQTTMAPTTGPAQDSKLTSDYNLSTLIGSTIHNYEVQRELARGNSGAVFLCRDLKQDRDIALKVLWSEISTDQQEMQRFIRAMKTMYPIRHPNLVQIYNAGTTGPYAWVALEYVDGESLTKVIERIGTVGMLDWQYGFRVAVQVARGLEAAYEHNIVHRNVTPENILVRAEDKVIKLGDMMLAKALESTKSEQITRLGQLVGELAYAPPERTNSSLDIDSRSDLYSLGATIYALLTGRPPFKGESLPTLISKIRNDQPASPKDFQLSISDMFEGVVLRLMAKNPDDRFQTPTELLYDLKRVGKFEGITI